MKFRKDINGLRAFAVIAVVLFHFNTSWMPGGFAGVDVFFVISGFLMTGIIFQGLKNKNFSVLNFYIARANRIIPALAVLCLALLVFGWFYLTPLEYKALGKHAASSVGFFSNIAYWREAGYFDAASHEKWLLHTWSLSVEWQFYIIYPIILMTLKRLFNIRILKSLIIIGTVLGFIFSVYATYKWPSASFYLFPMRAWEMMLGGIAFLYPLKLQKSNQRLLEVLGLGLIIGSYIFITGDNPWPGYLALLPVLGTFLVIQAQLNDSLITGNIIFQKLGAWSYSIYLWHWPFVVAIYTFGLPKYYIYIGMVLSVLLGYLSYKYIERIKFPRSFPTLLGYLKCKPVYMALFTAILGGLIQKNQGVYERFQISEDDKILLNQLAMPTRDNGYCFNYTRSTDYHVDKVRGANCYIGAKNNNPTKTLIFGDSYIGHYDPLFDQLFKQLNISAQSISTNSCYPSFSKNYKHGNGAYEQCLLNRQYVKENIHKYKNLIIGGKWDEIIEDNHLDEVKELIEYAAKLDINVFIMPGPYQYQKSNTNAIHRQIYLKDSFKNNFLASGNDYKMMQANKEIELYAENYRNVHFISREIIFEDNNQFVFNDITLPYTSDAGHLSIIGAKQSAENLLHNQKYKELMSNFEL